jgi:hypothetical protein
MATRKTEITRRILENDFSVEALVQENHPGARHQLLGRYRVWLAGKREAKKVVAVWNMKTGQFTLEEFC